MDVFNSSLLNNRALPWRWALWLPGGTVLACVLLLALRRLSGALEEPLSATLLLLSMLVALLAVWATVHAAEVSRPMSWGLTSVAGASIVILGAVLTLPGTSTLALAVLWVSVAAGFSVLVIELRTRHRAVPASEIPSVVGARALPSANALVAPLPESHETNFPGEWQRLSRLRTEDAADRMEGWVRVSCAIGQRSEVVHLSFCPPFEKTPELEVECHEGPDTRIKITQLLPYAARIELKLVQTPQEPVELLIGLSAICITGGEMLPAE